MLGCFHGLSWWPKAQEVSSFSKQGFRKAIVHRETSNIIFHIISLHNIGCGWEIGILVFLIGALKTLTLVVAVEKKIHFKQMGDQIFLFCSNGGAFENEPDMFLTLWIHVEIKCWPRKFKGFTKCCLSVKLNNCLNMYIELQRNKSETCNSVSYFNERRVKYSPTRMISKSHSHFSKQAFYIEALD